MYFTMSNESTMLRWIYRGWRCEVYLQIPGYLLFSWSILSLLRWCCINVSGVLCPEILIQMLWFILRCQIYECDQHSVFIGVSYGVERTNGELFMNTCREDLSCMEAWDSSVYGSGFYSFYRVENRLLQPVLYFCVYAEGQGMRRLSVNRMPELLVQLASGSKSDWIDFCWSCTTKDYIASLQWCACGSIYCVPGILLDIETEISLCGWSLYSLLQWVFRLNWMYVELLLEITRGSICYIWCANEHGQKYLWILRRLRG